MSTALNEGLKSIWLFEDLEREELDRLASLTRQTKYLARRTVIQQGDSSAHLHVILSGRVKVTTLGQEGTDAAYGILGPGDFFGEIGLLDGQPRSATVTTLEDSELARIDSREFDLLLAQSSALSRRLLTVLARRMRALTARLEDRVFLSVRQRLAREIVWLAETHGKPAKTGVRIELRLSQQELGDLVGATRESVNKHLREWTRDGLVRRDDACLLVTELGTLRDIGRSS